MKLPVYTKEGSPSGSEAELMESIFAIEPNDHAIWLDVRRVQANRHQGTHKSKGRTEVNGGGKKPFRQKGTGRARQGSSRAPHHVGGGRVFGPKVHTYHVDVNKKVQRLARKSALTYKAQQSKIFIAEDFNFDKPSTKSIVRLLSAINIGEKKVLICTADLAPAIVKSVANLMNVSVCHGPNFSTFDVLKADTIILQQSALQKVNEVLG